MPGGNTSTFQVNQAIWTQQGTYRCVVTNAVGTAISKNAVVAITSPPIIIVHPQPIKIAKGSTGMLKVLAGGTPVLKYQWLKNSGEVPKATAASLALPKATSETTGGNYKVKVTSLKGETTSNEVTVVVEDPPAIVTQPVARTVGIGDDTSFSVVASGAATLSYQWQKNNVDLAGQTSATLSLTAVQLTTAGLYRVKISNDVGVLYSAAVKLTVLTKPLITVEPVALALFAGDAAGAAVGNQSGGVEGAEIGAGGDIAAITGIAKAVLDLDDAAQRANAARVLDVGFIAEHTHGFDAYVAHVRDTSWEAIEAESGLTRAQLEEAARIYTRAKAVMGVYGMGLTQHRLGVQNVHAVCNLLLLRGNVGRPGAGASPVRGHSNVQGQRTVGIADRAALVPLDRLAEQYGFEPPREDGLNTVGTCEGVIAGTVHAFLQLGGNFLRAAPETEALERAWSKLRLTVHIATKLNRSHLVPGEVCYVLPCLGRSERDVQASGPQAVSMEDSTSCIHGSRGNFRPAHAMLRSELRIVADLAKATLPPNPKLDWDAWVGDYAKVRDAIEQTYPQMFRDFNQRLWQPGGFHKGNAARERKWNTPTGKANFLVPPALSATGFADAPDDVLRLTTIRSNDQFNTTIYGYDDRFRGISGTRMIVMIGAADAQRLGVAENDEVALASAAGDGVERIVKGLRVLVRELPRGTIAAYYPECNPLIPVWHHAEESHVPAGKSIPVRIVK